MSISPIPKSINLSRSDKTNSIHILAGDHIWLKGNNGSGKTTFLKILLCQIKNYSGQIRKIVDLPIGYFSQQHKTLNFNNSIYDNFAEATQIYDEQKVRSILANFLFRDKILERLVSNISQGERVRLIIAILTNQDNQFLFFDEPTNHLDIESRIILERTLANYSGGFILVSHDRYFLNRIGINRIIEIKQIYNRS